jgi:hypothetical protein
MSTLIQRSFSGGEIAPSVYARADQTKHQTGLRICRNFFVMRHGGVATRSGTIFVGETKDSTKFSRFVKFVFNADQTYALEFGNLYMRVHKAGAQVLEASKAITAITQANPGVVTSVAHGYLTGDEVVVSGIVGMTELNGRNLKVVFIGANTYSLTYLDGSAVDTTGFSAYISGGITRRVFELVTPYLEADLRAIEYVQSADVITITHPSYEVRDLSRLSDTNWTLEEVDFSPSISPPHGGTAVAGGAGAFTYRYRITALKEETKEESLPGNGATTPITGATNANPVVITAVAHGYSNGDEVYITGMLGMTELNGRTFTIAGVAANTFQLVGENGTAYGVWTSGGTVARTYIRINAAAVATVSAPHVITIPQVVGASEYNVYKEVNGVYGWLGVAAGTTFNDVGLEPDTTDTPPSERDVFLVADSFPSTVTYFQQRKLYANTNDEPEKVFGSRTGSFKNFTVSSPLQDDDAVTWELAGRQVNAVKHMIDLGGLVVFTSGGEWNAKGNAAGILVPGEVNPQQISYYGSGPVPPLIVGNTALFIQGRGSIVRDLGFDYQVDNYKGNDLTIFAAHLFDNFTVLDWDFQQIPHSVVWVVRDDGALLGLTYVREHQVWGWHRHDFDGTVEAVVSIPEGNEDSLYLTIKREIDGRTVRYVERLSTRQVLDIRDFIGMDSALSFDGRNTSGAHTMILTGGTLWNHDEVLTLTSSAAFFTAADEGNEIRLTAADGSELRLVIEVYTSPTVVSVRPQKDVPLDLQAIAVSTWSRAVDLIGGLWHLEGELISVLGDGFVVANPNNDAYVQITVTNGEAQLDKPYAVIHAGLPITADLYTLDVDTAQGETVVDKKKFTSRLHIFVEESRGIWAGTRPPDSDASLDGLFELKIRNEEGYDDPVSLATGVVDLNIEPSWNAHGRIFIRQTDPLPLSVLAVAPSGLVPFRGGGG